MSKSDKILRFMLEHESDEVHKLFDFYKFVPINKTVEGKDLQNLKNYIKENDNDKIFPLLDDLLRNKKYICYEKRQLNPLYDDLQLTDAGRKHLEDCNEIKRKWLMAIIPALIAFVGSLLISYNFPNETKIQTIVKTELKNTTNINITK